MRVESESERGWSRRSFHYGVSEGETFSQKAAAFRRRAARQTNVRESARPSTAYSAVTRRPSISGAAQAAVTVYGRRAVGIPVAKQNRSASVSERKGIQATAQREKENENESREGWRERDRGERRMVGKGGAHCAN